MAISLYKRPSDRNWSGNPIHYQLYSAAAEADATNIFEIKILFKRIDAADYSEIVVLPYNPVKGVADIDIQDVLEGLMEYEVPYLQDDPISAFFARKMTGFFYIAWREITTAIPDPAWVTTESANAKFVIKGGIAWHKWRGDNYWVNYFEPRKPFLTWQGTAKVEDPRRRLAGLQERMYLAWLNTNDIDPAVIAIRRKLVFTDNTNYSLDIICPVSFNEVAFIPAGAAQLKLEEVFSTKKIWYWELQMWDNNDNIPISEIFRYEADNRNFYDVIGLNYRNSLGGMDSVRITGVVDFDQQRQFIEQGSVVMHDYFTGQSITGRVKAVNSTELLVYKGDIGHLKKEEQQWLRDIHYQREVWWAQQTKWLPVMTMTGNQKLNSSDDQRWGTPIEFSIASGGDRYYTPDSVDLAEGALPNVVVCNAIISVPTYMGTGPYTVNWNLVSGAPVKYMVSTPGVSGGAPSETISTSYVFSWLPDGDNIIRVTPICFIGGEYYSGVPQYVTITVAPACTPVGISGTPVLPDATKAVPYAYTFSLTGTAPFVLANIIKPAWMTIAIPAIPGNDVVFSGTPAASDVGENLTVNFDIKNCSNNNFVNFDDEIDVGPPHNFKVFNEASFLIINNVTPGFYTLSNGTFPIGPGNNVQGDHPGFNGVISVVISTPNSPSLKLYVNTVLIQTVAISGAGTYPFTTRNYLAGDIIEIKVV